ncbi:MAG: methyltransferase domain-containing protein [Bryobacteraceae bacterium]|nr:methyltransferase domain-containing protein [Bryobacteraceae bacterium]
MIEALDIGPADRVLLLSAFDAALVRELSRRLERGLLVGLADGAALAEGRRAARNCVNVMFQPGSAEEIPWQDGYFTRVVDTECRWDRPERAGREIARVLAPGGVAFLAGMEGRFLVDSGLEQLPPAGRLAVFQKAKETVEQAGQGLRVLY